MVRRTKELRSGPVLAPPVEGFETYADVGAMISTDRFRDLGRVLEEAERNGATIETGGKPYVHPYFGSGAYYHPTVVGNPPYDSRVSQLERALFKRWFVCDVVVAERVVCDSVRSYCSDPKLRNCGGGHRTRQWDKIRSRR